MLIITVLQETMVCHTPKFTYYSVKEKTEIWLHQTPQSSNQCAHLMILTIHLALSEIQCLQTNNANLATTNFIEVHT